MGRRREFNESEVVDQAMDLFWQHGYRDATPAMLVEATGLSKSSLYATFGSKQGLFTAALQRYVEGQQQIMRQMLDRPTLREALERMYASVIAMTTAPEGARSCLLCTSSVEADRDHAGVAELLAEGQESMRAVIAERLVRAQQDGELDASRDVGALARFLVNNNMGMIVMARSGASADELGEVAKQVMDSVC